jgi:ABC-type transporter Mla subunit MlaD
VSNVAGVFAVLADVARELFQERLAGIRDIFSDIREGFTGLQTEGENSGIVLDILGTIIEGASIAFGVMVNLVQVSVRAFFDLVEAARQSAQAVGSLIQVVKGEATFDDVRREFAEAGDAFRQFGENVGQGIAETVRETVDAVKGAADSAGDRADRMREVFDSATSSISETVVSTLTAAQEETAALSTRQEEAAETADEMGVQYNKLGEEVQAANEKLKETPGHVDAMKRALAQFEAELEVQRGNLREMIDNVTDLSDAQLRALVDEVLTAEQLNKVLAEIEDRRFARQLEEDLAEANERLAETHAQLGEVGEALSAIPDQVGTAMAGVVPIVDMLGDSIEALQPKSEEWGEATRIAAEKGTEAYDEQQEKIMELAQAADDAARQQAQAAFDLAAAEKQAASDVTAKAKEERQKQIDAALETANAIGDFITGIGDFWSAMYDRRIADAGDAEAEVARLQRQQAIASKAFSIAEATINTAVAVTKVIANPVLAAIVGALGAAQIAAIIATPIPGAELGGSFVVPPGNNNDGGLVRVNSGEQVDVTPARRSGDSGGMPSTVVVRIGEREFAGAVEDAFNRGGAQIRRQGAVRVSR